MPRPKKSDITIIPPEKEPSIEAKAKAAVLESGLTVLSPDKHRDEVVVYEAVIDGRSRMYAATTSVPIAGKFFVMQTFEDEDRTRILISHRDFNESFPFSEGVVLTKYGPSKGITCNVTLKLVDVVVDVVSERVIGVYHVLMTPTFAQRGVDVEKLVDKLSKQDMLQIKEEILVHEALMLKFQLEESVKQSETYRQTLFERQSNIRELAEDFAAPIIEVTLSALRATEEMFDKWFAKDESSILKFLKSNWKIIAIIFAILMIGYVYFYGLPIGG